MKIPAIPFLTKKNNIEFFISLIIEPEKVSAILFEERDSRLIILASHAYIVDVEDASTEDLITASDNVISKLEMSLPDNATLEKTIFAVPYSWVEEGKIKHQRLEQLKKVCLELALTPMGFIVSIEAIITYLEKKEGAPINGIFVELSDKVVNVYISRKSSIIHVKHGVIEESVEKTVEKLLGSIQELDVLPPKIVLLHTKEAESITQKFLAYQWTKELPFNHLPQINILDRGIENEAIINGVATELNVSVNEDINITTSEEIGDEEVIVEDKNAFGFLKDEDVGTSEEKEDVKKEEDTFSFKEDEDGESKGPVVRYSSKEAKDTGEEEIYEEDEEADEVPEKEKTSFFSSAIGFIGSLITPSTFANIPKNMKKIRNLAIPFVALVVVILLIVAYYGYFLKAQISIVTDRKAIKEDAITISLVTDEDSSFSEKQLKISTIDEKVTGEETQETTGQKATGQKATGTITIFNKTEQPKKIDKGTVIASSNDLDFLLDDNVNVASTSSFSTSFSSSQGKVTAESFGKEYNIPSQTNFTVKNYPTSELFAKNDTAFSGGTKELIQVVAQKDLKDLEETVVNRLFDKAKNQVQGKLNKDDSLIPSYITYEFEDKVYDRKADEKAKNIKLDATINYTLGFLQ